MFTFDSWIFCKFVVLLFCRIKNIAQLTVPCAVLVALYFANDVSDELKITDGESFKLDYFSKNNLPNLESRAKVILDWLIEKEYLK